MNTCRTSAYLFSSGGTCQQEYVYFQRLLDAELQHMVLFLSAGGILKFLYGKGIVVSKSNYHRAQQHSNATQNDLTNDHNKNLLFLYVLLQLKPHPCTWLKFLLLGSYCRSGMRGYFQIISWFVRKAPYSAGTRRVFFTCLSHSGTVQIREVFSTGHIPPGRA